MNFGKKMSLLAASAKYNVSCVPSGLCETNVRFAFPTGTTAKSASLASVRRQYHYGTVGAVMLGSTLMATLLKAMP